MIEQKRLKELIKQGAKVWGYNDESVFDLPLKNTNDRMVCIPAKSLVVDWYAGKGKGWFTAYYDPNKLCETKEQAEWTLKTVAERTERFEPPMWEDLKDYWEFNFVDEQNRVRSFVIKKGCWIGIDMNASKAIFAEFGKDVTKENYEKACEVVRDLFKGGE